MDNRYLSATGLVSLVLSANKGIPIAMVEAVDHCSTISVEDGDALAADLLDRPCGLSVLGWLLSHGRLDEAFQQKCLLHLSQAEEWRWTKLVSHPTAPATGSIPGAGA